MDKIRPSVDKTMEYYDPIEHKPPKGETIYLYTNTGKAIIGTWNEECIGWRPLFRGTAEMKSRIIGNK